MATWVFLTGEYPPQQGGVADYSQLIAEALAKEGETVQVWAPQCAAGPCREVPGSVTVHRLPEFNWKSLSLLDAHLQGLDTSARLVVHYVPHAFGWKGMNVPFCLWLARQPYPLWVIFHEVRFAFRWTQPLRHNLLAVVTGAMASIVARSAERIYITVPAWETSLPGGRQYRTLPVPANSATEVAPADVMAARHKFVAGEDVLIGHFGSYGSLITPYLLHAIPALLASDPQRFVLLLGINGERFAEQIVRAHPMYRDRLFATGRLPSYELACHLAACDIVLQPYPDGVTGRRTSLMSALALGLPIVTTTGHLTEAFWKDSNAVALVPADRKEGLADEVEALLRSRSRKDELAKNARELYRAKFALRHTIDALRS
jgi:hypothetical protein